MTTERATLAERVKANKYHRATRRTTSDGETLTGCEDATAEVHALAEENERLREALELISAPKRPDGTYNRGREACEQIAREALA